VNSYVIFLIFSLVRGKPCMSHVAHILEVLHHQYMYSMIVCNYACCCWLSIIGKERCLKRTSDER